MESDRIHARAAIMRAAVNREDAPGAERRLAGLAGATAASRRSPASTRARSSATSATRARCAAASSRRGMAEARGARAASGRAADGRPRPRPRGHAGEPCRATATATARGSPRIDTGIKRSIVRNLVSRGARAGAAPVHDRARRSCWPATPTRSSCQRPGRPGRARLHRRHRARARRQAAGVRHLPRPPAAVPGRRPGDVQAARSATAAPTTRSRTCATGRIEITSQNHGFAVVGPDGGARSRPTSRCAGRPTSAPPSSPTSTSTTAPSRGSRCSTSPAARSSTTPRPGPGPNDSLYLFDRSLADRGRPRLPCRAATTSSKILILGSGPIVIGQAAEFDYSGVQACKVLREEGYEVVLVNSNPATIMTDPEFADATYVEPLLPGPGRAGHREGAPRRAAADARRPDGAQPRQGAARGRHARALRRRADRRQLRRDRPRRGPRPVPPDDGAAGLRMPRSAIAHRASRTRRRACDDVGLPAIVRPGLHARRPRRRHRAHARGVRARSSRAGIDASPIGQVLLDESVLGWGEFELEVMRDRNDNVRDRLLDREHRPDGRPHRRLGDGRAAADAHRPALPAAARPGDRRHPRGRRRDRRLQRPVRGQPGDRGDPRHRDEPARVALLRAGLEGHRASRSRRSPRAWPSATRSRRSTTTSRGARRRPSSRRSTTSSSSGRASPSRSSPASTPG